MSFGKQSRQTWNSVTVPLGVIRPIAWPLMLCGGLTCDSVNQKLPSDPLVIDFGLLFAVGILNCLSQQWVVRLVTVAGGLVRRGCPRRAG